MVTQIEFQEESKGDPIVVEPEVIVVEPIRGEVVVKYNHYKEKFPVVDGVLKEADIDEQYCLSHAYKGTIQFLLREERDPSRTYLPNEGGAWSCVELGKTYVVEVQEDEAAEAERRKNSKPISFYKEETKKNGRIDGITNQLKGMSIKELEEKGDKYKELIEARDLEDILYK